jgi:multiple sugar transport system ATP-binding protein
VALGRAIVRRPKLFLLDEPLSSLDGPLRVQMRGEIVRLQRQLGVTMILVTHDQHDAMSVGHRIAVVRAGELQQVARPQELYYSPANRFVAGFIGFPPMQFIPGYIRERSGTLTFQAKGDGEKLISLLIDKAQLSKMQKYSEREVVLGIRPEHLSIPAGASSSRPIIRAVVEWAEYLGAETILHLRSGALPLQMRLHNASQTGFVPGNTLEIAADMSQACYFDAEKGFALT